MDDFFETVKRGIEKGVASVGAKSREVLETSQLRSQIRALEDERKARLEELGNIAHVMCTRGSVDEARLREKSQGIAAIETSIREKEEQIRAIQVRAAEALQGPVARRVGQCACGGDLLEGSKFCGRCGRPSAPVAAGTEAAPGATACARCDAPLIEGAKFCGGCGAQL